MYYQDEFMMGFQDELSFHKYLSEIEERASWLRRPCKGLQVAVVDGLEGKTEGAGKEEMEGILFDTKCHTGLVLLHPDGCHALGTTAISTLKGRARIEGSALADIEKPVLAHILNECLKVAKGNALLRISEGKVRAVLSGDKKDYAILPMPELYMVASAYINSDFGSVEFLGGYADHTLTTAVWQVEDEKLSEAYEELMEQYGKKWEGDLKASIRIKTSDVGASGANIFYSLLEDGHSIILGEALKVQHKHCQGIEDFTENVESIFRYYKEALGNAARLLSIPIRHPANAMAGVMDKKGFAKRTIAETVEQFKAAAGDQPCSAYEVYCGICEALFFAKNSGAGQDALIKMEERIARCLSARWQDFDIPGDVRY